jgi:hypothetical protein
MNPIITALAIGFYIEQNRYFGWNFRPQSGAELIADGITVLLFALAVVARR